MTTVDRPTNQGWVADDSTFGARLALIRQRMRWGNVKEAATACGLPTESWRSWERDGRVPQRLVEVASIIADRTGCDVGWLIGGRRLRRSDPGPNSTYFSPPAERTASDQPKAVTPLTGRSAEPTRPPSGPRKSITGQKSGPAPRRPRVNSRLVRSSS